MSTTPDLPIPDPNRPADATSAAPKRMTRRRRIVRRLLAGLAALALVAGVSGYWALDRYVIDHVQVADVAALEAQAGTAATSSVVRASSASASADGASGTGEAAATVTATSYAGDGLEVTIEKVVTGTGDDQVTYFVADVVVTDATTLRAGFADNQFGENIIENTSTIAASYDAVFAINGDYYGYRDSGIVIRNGVLHRNTGVRTGLALFTDGTMKVYDETTTTGEELLAAGVWNTLSFGPAIVDGGEIVAGIEDVEVDTNFGNHSIQGEQPRTGIGLIDTNHFVFVVADGRSTGYSRGVTMAEFAQIFDDLGATVAYNLDGGGSSTMWFNGEVVNNPLGRGTERGTSDILYVA